MKNTYTNAYKFLCESNKHLKEQWKPIGSGLTRHRIIPGHQDGTYDDDNCTYLTLREHYIAHWLLWKINGLTEDRYAYRMMKGINPDCYPSMLGKKLSKETRAKISAAAKGRKFSDETRAKIGAAHKGKIVTEETKAKMSAANKGKKLSKETRAKMSAAKKNMSDETKAKIGAAKKGKKQSPEHKAKRMAAITGRKHTEEAKAKMSAARTGMKYV